MAPMPQWELPHTKVEQAQRTVGLLHKDFHYSVKNQKLISNAIPFEYIDVPLPANSQKLDLTMEVISIERSTYEVIGLPLRLSKNCWRASTVSPQRWRRWLNGVTIWQPNSFTNPLQFAFSPKLNFFILPLLAFISDRIALIFQNRVSNLMYPLCNK